MLGIPETLFYFTGNTCKTFGILKPLNRSLAIMDQSEEDAGTIAVLMLRMKESRLPRAERMLKKVNSGETLSDSDIQFLKRVYRDNRANQQLIKRNPEYFHLMTGFIDLYTEIIAKGIENEKAR